MIYQSLIVNDNLSYRSGEDHPFVTNEAGSLELTLPSDFPMKILKLRLIRLIKMGSVR